MTEISEVKILAEEGQRVVEREILRARRKR